MYLSTVPPTGLQVAVFLFLTDFLIAAGLKRTAAAIGWPSDRLGSLGNLIFFALAALVILSVPALRRLISSQLQAPSRPFIVEAGVVGLIKVANPFGVMGALALFYLCFVPDTNLVSALGVTLDRAKMDERFYSAMGLVQGILLAIVIGPFMVELVYRGLLFRAWERQWGWFPAMIATAIVFGLLHPSHMISAALGSVIYVCLLRRTGTLWAPIVAHAFYNLIVQWPLAGHVLLARKLEELPRFESWWLEFTALAFMLVALPAYIWSARHPEPRPAVGPSTLEPMPESR